MGRKIATVLMLLVLFVSLPTVFASVETEQSHIVNVRDAMRSLGYNVFGQLPTTKVVGL